jgi:hypothetical protein
MKIILSGSFNNHNHMAALNSNMPCARRLRGLCKHLLAQAEGHHQPSILYT